MDRTVRILGTHGVPAAYGGFETAAENVARFLVDRGWRVIVYCQVPGSGPVRTDVWEGIERVLVPVATDGWLGTSRFDLITVRDASRHRDLCLTFGYNTAVFNILQRVKGIPNVINMDGIEWSRARWGPMKQGILWTNERIACVVGDRLIADHPEIAVYLRRKAPARKISTITYGSHAVTSAAEGTVLERGLAPGAYLTLIARPLPENSLLELVQGFSRRPRGVRLAVLGTLSRDDAYHRQVLDAASDEVSFLGAVYDAATVQSLRLHSALYLHGHTVGGTNPSLVEALGAGNAVLAQDNPYNRWVARDAAVYFHDADDVDARLTELLADRARLTELGHAARRRHAEEFTWEHVAGQYEELLLSLLPTGRTTTGPVQQRERT